MIDTVPNKSDFIRNAIEAAFNKNELDDNKYVTKQQVIDLIKQELGNARSPLPAAISKGSEFIPKPPDPELGYPCCSGNTPCKHWVFVGEEGYWQNTLTGKTRDA
jgi:hypothetical protein